MWKAPPSDTAVLPNSEGTATYAWGLDGNMAARTWGSSISGTYSYDGAKRPSGLVIKFGGTSSGTFARGYDLAGNAVALAENGLDEALGEEQVQDPEDEHGDDATASRFDCRICGASEEAERA
jgi:hypothetical protein